MAYRALDKYIAEDFEDPVNRRMEFLRNLIFKDCSHAGVISTNHALCSEIINKIGDLNGKDVLVWFNPEFLFLIRDKFPKARIWFVTGSVTANRMGVFGQFGETIKEVIMVNPYDFESVKTQMKRINMKFDVIVGNPPYQDPRSKTAKLWFEFTQTSVALSKEWVAFITPNSWFFEPLGRKIQSTIQALKTGSIIFADTILPNEYFDVGEDIGFWIWYKNPGLEGEFRANWFGKDSIRKFAYSGEIPDIDFTSVIRKSIEIKLIEKCDNSIRTEGLKGMEWKIGPESVGLQEKLSSEYSDKYPIRVRLSPANTMYSSSGAPVLGVCVTNSGYYFKDHQDEKYMPITTDPTGQNFLKIRCASLKEAQNVKSYLTSKLYRCYVEHLVNKAFNDYALARLPYLGNSKSWTDTELYKYFDLSDEEIQYVEDWYNSK